MDDSTISCRGTGDSGSGRMNWSSADWKRMCLLAETKVAVYVDRINRMETAIGELRDALDFGPAYSPVDTIVALNQIIGLEPDTCGIRATEQREEQVNDGREGTERQTDDADSIESGDDVAGSGPVLAEVADDAPEWTGDYSLLSIAKPWRCRRFIDGEGGTSIQIYTATHREIICQKASRLIEEDAEFICAAVNAYTPTRPTSGSPIKLPAVCAALSDAPMRVDPLDSAKFNEDGFVAVLMSCGRNSDAVNDHADAIERLSADVDALQIQMKVFPPNAVERLQQQIDDLVHQLKDMEIEENIGGMQWGVEQLRKQIDTVRQSIIDLAEDISVLDINKALEEEFPIGKINEERISAIESRLDATPDESE